MIFSKGMGSMRDKQVCDTAMNQNTDNNTNDKGFGVAASPFNRVKLELGVIFALGLLLWLAADSITASLAEQLLLLGGYGLLGMLWLVWRTRRLLARHARPEQGP